MKRRFFNTVASVGQAVREARREHGITQEELAAKAHLAVSFVADLEAGQLNGELAEVLAVLESLDIYAVALPSVRSRNRIDDIDLDEAMKRFE